MSLYVGSTHNGELFIFEGVDPNHSCEVVRVMSPPPKKIDGPFLYLQEAEDTLAEMLEKQNRREVQLELDFG